MSNILKTRCLPSRRVRCRYNQFNTKQKFPLMSVWPPSKPVEQTLNRQSPPISTDTRLVLWHVNNRKCSSTEDSILSSFSYFERRSTEIAQKEIRYSFWNSHPHSMRDTTAKRTWKTMSNESRVICKMSCYNLSKGIANDWCTTVETRLTVMVKAKASHFELSIYGK